MNRLFPLALALLMACSGDSAPEAPPPPPPEPTPEVTPEPEPVAEVAMGTKAGAIAKELKASPDKSAEILAAHELTQEAFEAMLFEVAADAEQSKLYAAAMGGT